MVSVLVKKTLRELFHAKGMIIAVASIIAVGTGLMIGMYSTFKNLDNSRISYYSKCRMADFWIDVKKLPVAVLNSINTTGCSEIRDRIVFPAIVDFSEGTRPVSAMVVSMPNTRKSIINGIVIRSGSYFTPTMINEVIVSEKFAKVRKIKPGDFVNLIMKGQKKKLYVIGTAISSEFTYLTPPGSICPDPENYGVFWIKRSFAENVFDFQNSCNSVVGLLTPESRKNPDIVINKLIAQLKPYGVIDHSTLHNQFSNLTLISELSGLQLMAFVMPAIFLAIAALVLNIIMLRLAEQQRISTGTLKAIGVKNSTILRECIRFSLITGLVGGIVGCFIGYAMSEYLTNMYQLYFTFPNLHNVLYFGPMLTAILISIMFSVVGSIKGTKSIFRLSPAEAMRPPPPQIVKKIFLERQTWFWSKISFSWQTVLRSIFRNKSKTFIGIIASAMGAAIVCMSVGMLQSMQYMVVFQFDKVLRYDYKLSLTDFRGADAVQEAKNMIGIYYAEPQLELPCTFRNKNHIKQGAITGIIRDSKLLHPSLISGSSINIPSSGFVLSSRMAKLLNVKKGDYLNFTPSQGLRQVHKVKVTNVVNTTFGLPVYADFSYLNKIISEEGAISSIMLKAQQSPQEKTTFMKKLKQYPAISSFSVTSENRDQMENDFVSNMSGMIYTLILFAAVIFFCSILNSSIISISERRNEIATYKVLGYKNWEINSVFLREIMLVNVTGAVLGLPLGYLALYGMCLMYQNDMYSMPCITNFNTYAITLILCLLFIFSVFLLVRRMIIKLNCIEALNIKI